MDLQSIIKSRGGAARGTGTDGRSTGSASDDRFVSQEAEAQDVAARLPQIMIEASRIAATIIHGVHGRRRAGPGDTFWQFRPYSFNDDASLIDWRRSASSDHVFVREREWEAAQTFWLWPDLSPSMNFASHLSRQTKRDRALVLTLAAAEILVKAGERVAILGLMRPTANRNAATRLAETLAANATTPQLASGLPPAETPSRFSGLLMVSDFLEPIAEIEERMAVLGGAGVGGHMIQVLDPAEEVLPYEGRAEFVGMSNEIRWTAERTETLREAYLAKLEEQRSALRELARKRAWSFTVHHTDRPPTEPLLALITRLQHGDSFAGLGTPGAGA
ncbi:MAG: DUF58 domain-containing protein [Pseudomonadota bacterium]